MGLDHRTNDGANGSDLLARDMRFAPERLARLAQHDGDERTPYDAKTAAEARLTEAIELFNVGVQLTSERLRREHPAATAAEVDDLVARWIHAHDGAEHGDADGVPASAERMRRLSSD